MVNEVLVLEGVDGGPSSPRRRGRKRIVPDPDNPKILTRVDVAALVGVDPKSVDRWLRNAECGSGRPVPPYDHAGACAWLRSTIVAWLLAEGLATPDDVYGGR